MPWINFELHTRQTSFWPGVHNVSINFNGTSLRSSVIQQLLHRSIQRFSSGIIGVSVSRNQTCFQILVPILNNNQLRYSGINWYHLLQHVTEPCGDLVPDAFHSKRNATNVLEDLRYVCKISWNVAQGILKFRRKKILWNCSLYLFI